MAMFNNPGVNDVHMADCERSKITGDDVRATSVSPSFAKMYCFHHSIFFLVYLQSDIFMGHGFLQRSWLNFFRQNNSPSRPGGKDLLLKACSCGIAHFLQQPQRNGRLSLHKLLHFLLQWEILILQGNKKLIVRVLLPWHSPCYKQHDKQNDFVIAYSVQEIQCKTNDKLEFDTIRPSKRFHIL